MCDYSLLVLFSAMINHNINGVNSVNPVNIGCGWLKITILKVFDVVNTVNVCLKVLISSVKKHNACGVNVVNHVNNC